MNRLTSSAHDLSPLRSRVARRRTGALRDLGAGGLALALALGACSGSPAGPGSPSSAGTAGRPSGSGPAAEGPGANGPAPGGTATKVQPAAGAEPGRVLLVTNPEKGEEKAMDARAATEAGYTIINLSDDWTPTIFAEQHDEAGHVLQNRYRRVFVGLANDQLDSDGIPLPPGEKNYLELYGIFPSFSVLRSRFLQSETKTCTDPEGQPALEAVETVSYVSPQDLKKDERRLNKIREELEKARKKAHLKTVQELIEKDPAFEPKQKLLDKRAAEKLAMVEVEKRLFCENLLTKHSKHQIGIYDEPMRLAVRNFQQKNMIYEANYLRRKTMDALARPSLDNDQDALLRGLRERVTDAAGIIEDGSTEGKNGAAHVATEGGGKEPLRNLVDEYTQAAAKQLGIDTAAGSLAFFKRHPAEEFQHLRVAVKLPPRPAYYSADMDLSIVVDRGDVWYDPPWDENDHWNLRPRKKYPSLTLVANINGQKVSLVRWRTTIGGWRSEQAPNGYEYYRYKGSDVGPRVIRHVVSGPVWIAPESTPIRSLVKGKLINKHWESVVNYDELGPGYLSAYGVVAGYFVIPGKDGRPDFDNGIRAHGSSDYLSIYSNTGYSHGCHRLPNHLAIRLYDFLLHHRPVKVEGDSSMGFARQFLWKDTVYEVRLPSRGFVFTLEPPLPVTVLEGEIKGNAQKPIVGYVPKPGVKYPPGPPPPSPDQKNGSAAAAVEESP